MKNRWLIGLSVVLIMVFSLSACSSLGDVSDLGNQFMSALSTGDNAASYQMLHPEIHTEVGGEAGWAEWTSIRNFEKWKFTSTSIDNTTAELQGTAELTGETYDVVLIFDQVDDTWLITGISFE
jgi:hypothetical protein